MTHSGASKPSNEPPDEAATEAADVTAGAGKPTLDYYGTEHDQESQVLGELAVPPRIEGYEVLSRVGRGGMGVVYKARQRGLKRLVALKMILSGTHAGASEVARFRTEAEAAARLQHPHIVQVHQVGEWTSEASGAPLPFLALEYVDGGSLSQHLKGTPQAARVAAQLVFTLAGAMQYAHDQQVVHRDLKPANILLATSATPSTAGGSTRIEGASSRGGSSSSLIPVAGELFPKIADFGLAKQLDDHSGQTMSGAVLGTPSYMAPEQASGKVSTVGPAADIYALGAILYELLTGRPPFVGTSPLETLDQVRHQEPVPPSRLQPKVPRDLETICLKCLQKEPDKRYPSAAALADDLRRYLNDQPILARPVGSLERLWRWRRRNPGIAVLTGGIALALLAGSGVSTYFAVRATRSAQTAIVNEEIALQRKDESDRRRYVAEFRWALQKWKDGKIDEVEQILSDLEPKGDDLSLCSYEWYYLRRLCQLDIRTLRGHSETVFGVACSHDGRWIASGSKDKTVRIWERATGRVMHILEAHTGQVFSVAYSDDDRRLASASEDKTIKVWDAATGVEQFTLTGHDSWVRSVGFHPSGATLASGSMDGTVRIWDLATQRSTTLTKGPQGPPIMCVVFTPDGVNLLAAVADGTIQVWDVAKGEMLRCLAGHVGTVETLAVSTDGLSLASGGDDDLIKIWDTKTWQPIATLAGHDEDVKCVAFSPDGSHLVSCAFEGFVRVWDVATAQETLTLRGHTGPSFGVAFSPDGRNVVSASSDHTLKIWDADSSQERVILSGHSAPVVRVGWSVDGNRLASAGYDGVIRIWDVLSGQEEKSLLGHRGAVYGLSYSSRRQLIASTGEDQTIRLWDARAGQEIAQLPRDETSTVNNCCAFSADGNLLATGGQDGTIIVWNVDERTPVGTLKGHAAPIDVVAFTADGSQLLSVARDKSTRVWDLSSGETVWTLRDESGQNQCAAFSSDASALVEGVELRVWDAASREQRLALRRDGQLPFDVVFSPDGKRIASTGSDGMVRVWDVATGLELLSLSGLANRGRAVAFSEDGLRLAAAGEDGLVHLWDAVPLDQTGRDKREAGSLVRFLWNRGKNREQVIEAIRKDSSVSDEVRRKALEIGQNIHAAGES